MVWKKTYALFCPGSENGCFAHAHVQIQRCFPRFFIAASKAFCVWKGEDNDGNENDDELRRNYQEGDMLLPVKKFFNESRKLKN